MRYELRNKMRVDLHFPDRFNALTALDWYAPSGASLVIDSKGPDVVIPGLPSLQSARFRGKIPHQNLRYQVEVRPCYVRVSDE